MVGSRLEGLYGWWDAERDLALDAAGPKAGAVRDLPWVVVVRLSGNLFTPSYLPPPNMPQNTPAGI